jgi:CheY-like chemotaxis protein
MEKAQILLAEDDKETARAIESCLKDFGYAVITVVANGEDAIEKAKENTPDLVLMDIMLKGEIDGIEAAKEIHTQFDIPIIFLADYADKESLKRASLSYPFGFILKPIQPKDLEVTIEMALHVAKQDAEHKNKETSLREKTHLINILLDAIPCVALLIRPTTREIVLANKAGREAGAVQGTTCYDSWGQRDEPCPWCLAPEVWATGKPHHQEVNTFYITWDAYWHPIDDDLYLHYAFDITEQRKKEEKLGKTPK